VSQFGLSALVDPVPHPVSRPTISVAEINTEDDKIFILSQGGEKEAIPFHRALVSPLEPSRS
jgi:hypothetical protein